MAPSWPIKISGLPRRLTAASQRESFYVEPVLDPYVCLECREAGNLEPRVHEDLAVRPVVINVNTGLPEAIDERSGRHARASGESGGIMRERQRALTQAEVDVFPG